MYRPLANMDKSQKILARLVDENSGLDIESRVKEIANGQLVNKSPRKNGEPVVDIAAPVP